MQSESPHLQLCPGDLLPTLQIATVIFKDAPREQCVFETTWIGYVTEHHYDLYYKCLRFWQMGTLSWPPRTSACMYISLLIKLTAYPSRVACLFLLPLLVSTCSGGTVSDITPGTPHVLSHQEHSVTFFMFTLCIHQRI